MSELYNPSGEKGSSLRRATSAEALTGTAGDEYLRTNFTRISDRIKYLDDNGLLAFPATQVASADPNTLDDYEEGFHVATITCSTSGTVTLNSSFDTLQYTKIGRLVHVQGRLVISAVSSPVGYALISMPFTSAAGTEGSGYGSGSIAVEAAAAGFAGVPQLLVQNGEAGVRLYEFSAGTIAGAAARLVASANLYISVTYSV